MGRDLCSRQSDGEIPANIIRSHPAFRPPPFGFETLRRFQTFNASKRVFGRRFRE
jgi:hypothetical protein